MWYRIPAYRTRPEQELDRAMYIGVGEDEGFYCFYVDNVKGYVISEDLEPSIDVGGYVSKPVYSLINGARAWGFGYDQHIIYAKVNKETTGLPREYMIMDLPSNMWRVYPGVLPFSWYNSETQKYEGEGWWQTSYDMTVIRAGYEGVTFTFTPQGTLLNSDPIPENWTATVIFEHWAKESDVKNPAGVYKREGYPDKIMGTPRYQDNQGNKYTAFIGRGTGTEKNYYKGDSKQAGDIRKRKIDNVDYWIIGEFGSFTGWWQADEPPKKSGAATFEYTYPQGVEEPETKPADKIISFLDYTLGEPSDVVPVMIAEVPVCR